MANINISTNISTNISMNNSRLIGTPLVEEHFQEFKIFQEWAIALFYTLYMLILFFGVSGNILTCTVIVSRHSMRRSIHFYTFNLAICDLLILCFYIPTQLTLISSQMEWKMGLTMCKVSYFVLPIGLYCTVGTLLAITIDRARGLLQPFKWRSDSLRNAKIAIPIIWCASLVLSIPLFIVPRLRTYEDGMTTCTEEWPSESWSNAYWIGMFVVCFGVPLNIIFVIHIIMVIVISKETNQKSKHYNKRMIRMTIAVVVVFTICTGYQHVYYFIDVTNQWPNDWSISKLALVYCFGNFMVSLQAAINPIIYGTLRHDFYRAYKTTIMKLMIFMKIHRKESKKGRSLSLYMSVENVFSDVWDKDDRKESLASFASFRKGSTSSERRVSNNNLYPPTSHINSDVRTIQSGVTQVGNTFLTVPTSYDYRPIGSDIDDSSYLHLPNDDIDKSLPSIQLPDYCSSGRHTSVNEEPKIVLNETHLPRRCHSADEIIFKTTPRTEDEGFQQKRIVQYRVSFAKMVHVSDNMISKYDLEPIPLKYCETLDNLKETDV